jgi:hypothetical protein
MIGTFEDAVLLASQKAGYEKRPEIIHPEEDEKGILNYLINSPPIDMNLLNLDIFPLPQYRLYYGGGNP